MDLQEILNRENINLLEAGIIRSHKFSFHLRKDTNLIKIFKLIFNKKDGSIFLTLPRLKNTEGILSYSEIPAGSRNADVSMKQSGTATSHIVKYSHHPDGTAHFSLTDKVRTEIRKKSEELMKYDGHFCSITIQSPSALILDELTIGEEEIYTPMYSSKDQTIAFNFDYEESVAFKFIFYYFPVENYESYIKIPKDWIWYEPGLSAINENGEFLEQIFFISSTKEAIGAKHVMMVRAAPVTKVSKEPRISFIGGFDPGNKQKDLEVALGFLALSYPIDDFKALVKEIGSVVLSDDLKNT